ncbi:MMPL family transporter [Labedaea rhizosphaerae]|uniref:RND superfamily putative drug exporter n=1 Tax=Labedaea rhizosphaerae TaxID=598644 RepID=A0A4R6SEK9_LABRH|nr:MMPL family transporter [Labedaea rhizosphaerae]TDP97486.1 RND superfamily putative drug exporter [Labedaea rhizosphaerae]
MKTLMDGVGRLARIPSGRVGKWVVVALWIVAVAALAPLGGKLSSVEDNQASAWLPGDAESTKAMDVTKNFQANDEVPTILIYEKPSGFTAEELATLGDQVKRLPTVPGVLPQVLGPQPSAEKPAQAAQVMLTLKLGGDGGGGWDKLPDTIKQIKDIAAPPPTMAGATMHVTGPGGNAADQAEAFSGIDGTLLFAAVGVVVVMLLLTYRSPILWLLPVLTAGFALFAAQGVIYLFAKYAGLSVNGQSAGILTVLVFGAGTDYALLLVARYREELRRHKDRHEAMAFALHRAGPAIWASAATVMAGMLCLIFAALNSTAGLGPVAAIGIGVALLAMVTLLPALLAICGRWLFWPVRPSYGSDDHTKDGFWAKIGRGIAKRPRITWAVAAVVLGVIALNTLNLKADGLTNAGNYTTRTDAVIGEEIAARHFPGGGNGQPMQVVTNVAQADQVRDAVARTPGIVPQSVKVSPPKGGVVMVQGTPSAQPDSPAAAQTLLALRDAVHQVPGADAKVGGMTAVQYDVGQANDHDRDLIIPIVLVLVFLILAALLRALVAPLLLIGTVVLSFFTAMGISSFFFDNVFGFEGADQSFPLFVFVFLVALGIDYNIFLMTRVREEALQFGTRRGALTGLAATGGVITSAGLVLAGTFAVLATLPLVAFAEIGFAVAVGVLIDTIIIRAVLVTALTLDVGRFMWWPGKLFHKRDEPETESSDRPESEALAVR